MHLLFFFLLFTAKTASQRGPSLPNAPAISTHLQPPMNLKPATSLPEPLTPCQNPHFTIPISPFLEYLASPSAARRQYDYMQNMSPLFFFQLAATGGGRGNGSNDGCGQSILAAVFQDLCILRYINMKFLFHEFKILVGILPNNVEPANPIDFFRRVAKLMVHIAWEASMATSTKFAVGEVDVGNVQNQKIYGMVWCTRYASTQDCFQCVLSTVRRLPYTRQGGRVFHSTCLLRFEVYIFFDQNLLKKNDSPKLSGPDVGVKNDSVSAGGKEHDANEEEVRREKSLHLKFGIINAATNNFSEVYKLGEGGFGPFYKGILHDGLEIAVKTVSELQGRV